MMSPPKRPSAERRASTTNAPIMQRRAPFIAALAAALPGAAAAAAEEVAQQEPVGLSAPLKAYSIGEGFTGSASDWTEYVVWSVGIAALIWYFSGVVKIDVHAKLPDDADLAEPEDDDDDDDGGGAAAGRRRTPKCD